MVIFKLTRLIKNEYKNSKIFYQQKLFCMKSWNILFFGTDDFSMSSLKCLNTEFKMGNSIKSLGVVTSIKNKLNPVYKYAQQERLKVHSWPVKSLHQHYDLGIVVSFGHLIPENIIKTFPLGMLNVHASLLPRWRGAAPIIHAIANGDRETGITIMRIAPNKFDVGDIIKQSSIEIPDDIKMPELHQKLSELGATLLMSSVYELPECLASATQQPKIGITYAKKVTPDMSQVDWHKSAQQIYSLSRALYGLYPLKTTLNGTVIRLMDLDRFISGNNHKIIPGLIKYNREHNVIYIQCVDGNWLSVKKIGIEGKKPMSARDFKNGFMKKAEDIIFI